MDYVRGVVSDTTVDVRGPMDDTRGPMGNARGQIDDPGVAPDRLMCGCAARRLRSAW